MTDIKMSFRVTKREKEMFMKASEQLGFKHYSEFFRIAAHKKIKNQLPDFYREHEAFVRGKA